MYEAKEKALADGVVSRNAWEKAPLTASSDSGGVSQMMPMNLFTAVCWPFGVAPHTWQSCASAGSTIGQKGAFYAAKVIAATAYDLYIQPELRKEIQDEFDAQDREPYAPMYEGE
jgi:aminobenzoyl-glutamate utilization protein B